MNAEAAATRHFAVEPQKGEIVAVVHLAADLVAIDVLVGKIRPQFLHDGEAGVDVGVAGCEGDGEFLSIHGGHFPPVGIRRHSTFLGILYARYHSSRKPPLTPLRWQKGCSSSKLG